ncbi:ExbD/TolR family protein [Prochlorococcus marinus]|uniref:ExbD/TolR family protein n=1 Tax=Prochlorococcus marinus TaxID=1219 RepID=UPI0039AF0696
MPYHKEDINSDNQINILPMIDIIFAILSFLIVSSLYLTRVDTIPLDLPKASTSVRLDKNFITVSIDKSGNLFINKIRTELHDMKVKVVNLTNGNKNLVVLNADKNISHGYVIRVLDMLRSIDGLKIGVSTNSID